MMGPLHQGTGAPFFHFDREYKTMILNARGENTSGIYYFDRTSPNLLKECQIFNFIHTTHKAISIMPKHAVDVGQQEVLRAARSTNTNQIEVLALRIPSKLGGFN